MAAAAGGTSRLRPPAAQVAEVSWFDVGDVTLGSADLAGLDARETARAAAFVFPGDRHRYQAAHVLLRRVLGGYLGAEPSRLVFGRDPCPACGGPSGRPVLAGPPPARGPVLSFSLAHSGAAVAIAVAGQPVGIDVERDAAGCVCSLVSAMHPSDAALVEPLPEAERHAAIIGWWVRAEAVLKCAGTGIGHGMDAFPVLGGPVRNQLPPGPRLPWEPGAPGRVTAAGCSFTALSAPRGYQAAIALPGLKLIRYHWGLSVTAGAKSTRHCSPAHQRRFPGPRPVPVVSHLSREVGHDGGVRGGRVPDAGGKDQGSAIGGPPRSPLR